MTTSGRNWGFTPRIGQSSNARTGPRFAVARIVRGLETLLPLQTSGTHTPLEMFLAFEGRDVTVNGDACHVEVYGVHDDGEQRWVQLALEGDTSQMVTLRFDPNQDPDCAVVSLAFAQPPASN